MAPNTTSEGGEQTQGSDKDDATSPGLSTDAPSEVSSDVHNGILGVPGQANSEIWKMFGLSDTVPSIVEIKRALPPHVFESYVSTSMYYAIRDVVKVVALYLLAEWLWSLPWMPSWLLWVLLPFYWLLQGTLFTAVFVVGHDAGHSSFSSYDTLNDIVGTIMHTFLLCPYYCWKLTHRHHHKNTGNIEKDEVFYPIRAKDNNKNVVLPGFGLGVGWIGYLIGGYGPRAVSHFNLADPIFSRHVIACTISIGCLFGWAAVLFHYALAVGFWKLFVHFLIPDLIFACYIVIITFLHHTEDEVPWYDDSVWEYVRGQVSSVDRHYGWCHNTIHNIGTHQIHHLFSRIPHYHLEEATAVFRRKFPQLVQIRNERILPAFCRMFGKYARQCVIPDSALIHLYK